MIDTSKYEGHTEGLWRVVTHENNEWHEEPPAEGVVLIASPFPFPLTIAVIDNRWQMDDNGLDLYLQHSTTGATAREMFNANEQLIADAPLILQALIDERAEVKRLREELNKQMEYIEWLEQFAPKAGEYNTSWEAYELAKEGEEQ